MLPQAVDPGHPSHRRLTHRARPASISPMVELIYRGCLSRRFQNYGFTVGHWDLLSVRDLPIGFGMCCHVGPF